MRAGSSHQSHLFLTLAIISACFLIRCRYCTLLQIDEFYSQSFMPSRLQIDYRVEHRIGIYYNVTVLMPLQGKFLLNVFVRKLASTPGAPSMSVLKYKNLDFCKIMEVVRNLTTKSYNGEMPQESTFIDSCPLTRGFYYISNGTIEDDLVPLYFASGDYWVQLELVQVFDEVNKLGNVKARCQYKSSF